MAKVGTKNTDIEKQLGNIVKSFWKIERYRKNVKALPGKPDIVFPKNKVAIFADGDFWHGKSFNKWKSKIPGFWRKKIADNIKRDRLQNRVLRKAGYKVLRFYGSKIKKNPDLVKNTVKKNLR